MTTYNTGNPLGSVDVRDLYDNAQNTDNFANGPLDYYADRFGVMRQSLQGIRSASQYVDLGPYGTGLVFTARNQVFSYMGEFYSPGPAITLPYTTTGAGAGEIANFRSVGDAVLRSDLAAADGASLVGFGAGTVEGTLSALDEFAVRQTGATGAAKIPSGTTAQRPGVPVNGMFRDNTDTDTPEIYSGGQWLPIGQAVATTLATAAKTFIDGAPLTKFGDMTLGEGLAGLFDTKIFNAARREAASGYAGLTLPAPAAIDFVEIVSGTNGFDGSGGANTATLTLYGKNGSAPSSATDGTLLGTSTVADDNTQKTGTVYSSSTATWDHVWVRIQTAVWAVAAEVRFFKVRAMPAAAGKGTAVNLSSCDNNVALTSGGREIPQFRIPLRLTEPRVINLDFHADVVHTAEGGTGAIAVGFSFILCTRSGATEAIMRTAPFTQVVNALGGGNVAEINPQHYGNKSITSAVLLPAGFHEISVIGSGHTDGSPVPGILQVLSEAGQGLNQLRAVILP